MKNTKRLLISYLIVAFAFTSCKKDEDDSPEPVSNMETPATDTSSTEETIDENKIYISVPDTAFKSYLQSNTDINLNGDTEISVAEAKSFTGRIYVNELSINDLTGIEEFVNITELSCDENNLTSLDVSKNIALEELSCEENNLTRLDVSENTALIVLSLDENKLENIDLTSCVLLEELSCDYNELVALDVTSNTALELLGCQENLFSDLDLSKNTALKSVYCQNNANLYCIKVETNSSPTSRWNKDNQARWATNCDDSEIIEIGFPDDVIF